MYIRSTQEFWNTQYVSHFDQALYLILKFLKWTFPVLFHPSFSRFLKWNVCIVSGTGTLSGYDDCLACALASFTWVKATLKWLSTVAFSIVQPCNGPWLVKGLNQKRTRLITLIFSHCNLMGGKVSPAPMMHWLSRVCNSDRALLPLMYLTGVTFSNKKSTLNYTIPVVKLIFLERLIVHQWSIIIIVWPLSYDD